MRARMYVAAHGRRVLDVGYSLGVDLGTTATAAAVCRNGRAEIVAMGGAAAVIPSVVFVKEDGTVLVGDAAYRRALSDPGRLAREFKRRVGDPTPLLLGGSPWSAESLMARLLRWTVDTVVEREGEQPEHIAVTHPANWGPYKLDLLTQAVRLAETKVDRYLTEPEAAAIAYAANERVVPDQILAVYDLGGGTFDSAVLHTAANGFEILGDPEGIERLGGIDFDQAVLAHVAAALDGAIEALDPSDPAVLGSLTRLRRECVEAKEALSTDSDTSVHVMLPGISTEVLVTRAEFEAMVRPPIAETVSALRRALRSAGVAAEDISSVLLVGGSSRIPLVADMVGKELGRPVSVDAHPKHAVAIGAALAAADVQVVTHDDRAASAAAAGVVAATDIPVPEWPAATVAAAPVAVVDDPAPVVEAEPVPVSIPVPAAGPEPAPIDERHVHVPPPPSHLPPAPPAAPPSPPSRRPPGGRSRALVIGAAAAVVVVVAAVTVFAVANRGSNDKAAAGTTSNAATAPTTCPGGPSVCIQDVTVSNGVILADFVANGVTLADVTSGGAFPADSVHPLFFFANTSTSSGKVWGPNSPFGGTSASGLTGFQQSDAPSSSTSLCVVLQNSAGQVFTGTGNCAPIPS